jgi:hypothetical protein
MTLAQLPSIYSFESLRAYLRKFAPSQQVGLSRNAFTCPLHEWLRAETGEAVYVGAEDIKIGDLYYEMPAWARKVKALIDAIQLPKNTYFKPITAKQALAALDAAESEATA